MRFPAALACCEGALLLVDAFQGVEAQTVANAYAAINEDLEIVPVINKVDLVHARVDEVLLEMEQSLAIDPDEVLRAAPKRALASTTCWLPSSNGFRRRGRSLRPCCRR
jgi:GTP-binding protein LepA